MKKRKTKLLVFGPEGIKKIEKILRNPPEPTEALKRAMRKTVTQEEVNKAYSTVTQSFDPHRVDCEHICDIVHHVYGVSITINQAREFWEEHSEMYAAGWLFLEDDQEVARLFSRFIECRLNDQPFDA